MSDLFEWVPLQAVLELHDEQLAKHGGAAGLRDSGALEAALARPQTLLGYEPEATVFRLAAAYAYGMTRNHAFVDGNKRIALITAGTFLALNGWYLDATERETVKVMLAVSARDMAEEEFVAWLEARSLKL